MAGEAGWLTVSAGRDEPVDESLGVVLPMLSLT